MPFLDYLGVAPWVVISAAATWLTALWHHRGSVRKEVIDRDGRLEIHRDDLTLDLIQNARSEMDMARKETVHLREEVRSLRAMEDHFFRFQQALDHLEALLFFDNEEARLAAERNARAFLTRMRKIKQENSNAG